MAAGAWRIFSEARWANVTCGGVTQLDQIGRSRDTPRPDAGKAVLEFFDEFGAANRLAEVFVEAAFQESLAILL